MKDGRIAAVFAARSVDYRVRELSVVLLYQQPAIVLQLTSKSPMRPSSALMDSTQFGFGGSSAILIGRVLFEAPEQAPT
jgi:hypothetical protein